MSAGRVKVESRARESAWQSAGERSAAQRGSARLTNGCFLLAALVASARCCAMDSAGVQHDSRDTSKRHVARTLHRNAAPRLCEQSRRHARHRTARASLCRGMGRRGSRSTTRDSARSRRAQTAAACSVLSLEFDLTFMRKLAGGGRDILDLLTSLPPRNASLLGRQIF